MKLVNNDLINAAAHITGGGLIENLMRSIPKDLNLNIDLKKLEFWKYLNGLKAKIFLIKKC